MLPRGRDSVTSARDDGGDNDDDDTAEQTRSDSDLGDFGASRPAGLWKIYRRPV